MFLYFTGPSTSSFVLTSVSTGIINYVT